MKFINPVLLTITLGAAGIGCGGDDEDARPRPICQDAKCPEQDGGADDVGDGDGDEPEPYKACVLSGADGNRSMLQCSGHVGTRIDFSVEYLGKSYTCEQALGSDRCNEAHDFGDEPADAPAVMACCDAEGAPEADVLDACARDLAEQVCRSVSARLEKEINSGSLDAAKGQAKKLLAYINDKQQDCFWALYQPSDTPGVISGAEWRIPNSKKWKNLKDFTIRVTNGTVESAAASDGPPNCDDNTANNTEIFEDRGESMPALEIDGYQLADEAEVSLAGPLLANARVAGLAVAAPQSVCASPRCSVLELGTTGGINMVVEELSLYADAPAEVVAGDMLIDVEDLSLRLYGAVIGYYVFTQAGGTVYMVDPGAAHFLVRGSIGGSDGTRWAINRDTIRLRQTDEGWMVEPFTVVHVDALGGAWEASIPRTTWD